MTASTYRRAPVKVTVSKKSQARLACHAVPGFGDAVAVEVQPDDGEVLALLQCVVPGGGFAPAGRAGQGGPRGSGASPCSGGRLTDAGMDRVRQRGQRPGGCGRRVVLPGWRRPPDGFEVPVDGFAGHAEGFCDLGDGVFAFTVVAFLL